MAEVDGYVLSTTEDGELIARNADGRTISAEDYYGRLVDQTYINETGRASTFNDPGGRQYWTELLMSRQVQPDQLDEVFSATDEGRAFDARTGNTGGITTIDAGTTKVTDGTTKVTDGTTKVTDGTTKVTDGTTKVTDGTTKVTTTGGMSDTQARNIVTRMYGEQLGRTPTDTELGYWVPDVVAGRLDEAGLLAQFNASPEGAMFDRIGALYPLEVGRPADLGGQSEWARQIREGSLTYDQLAKLMSETTEGRNFDLDNLSKGLLSTGYVDPTLTAKLTRLKDLYKTKLGRDPDEKGLRFYLGQEGEDYDFNKAVTTSPEALVRDAFKRVLGREPDATAMTYYQDELKKGRTYDQIVSDLRRSDEYQTKVSPVRGPGDVLYSNPATAARAATDFAGFPLTSKAVTGADGKVTNKLELNLPDQKDFSLGTKEGTFDTFKDYTPTVFAENPYVSNIFGGPSKADADRTGVGGQRVFGSPATATQDYSNLGIGTAGGITSLADVTKAANAAPFTLGNTMANNLGTNLGTTAGTNLDLTSNAGTIGMAQGGMIMSDPVMRRAMFRNGGPVSAKGYGITSNVTTPDENAMAMQTMFQPQGFRDGGPVQYFQQGGEAGIMQIGEPPISDRPDMERIEPPVSVGEPDTAPRERVVPKTPVGRSIRDFFYPSENAQKNIDRAANERARRDAVEEARRNNPVPTIFDEVTDAERQAAKKRQQEAVEAAGTNPGEASQLAQARAQIRQAIDDRDDINREGRATVSERTPPPDDTGRRIAERVPATTSLEKLKADREANKAQRRENQLLALMQAGFAMAAGRSPNALANLAAGGASGVATLAGLEKERRADDALLRREILETELAQERMGEARAERQAARQQTASERESSRLQTLSTNINNRIQNIRSDILSARTKLLVQGITDEQKRPVEIELENLAAQYKAEQNRLEQLYDRLGVSKPQTAEPPPKGFRLVGAKQ